jgi:hypothetical protein
MSLIDTRFAMIGGARSSATSSRPFTLDSIRRHLADAIGMVSVAVATLFSLSGLAAQRASGADCSPGEYLVDEQGNPLCWPAGRVPVCFNDQLDPNLDVSGGAGLRWLAFQRAVAEWNAALLAVGSGVQLTAALNPGCWAIDQTARDCADPMHNNHDVYDYVWINDNSNDASTGRPSMDTFPGWVKDPGEGIIQYSQIPDSLKQEVLARCRVQGMNGVITRADIGWMTQVETIVDCPAIPWNFNHTIAPGNFPGEFDWYSVMLHELGHLLGLGHLDPGETGVMQPSIEVNTRLEITDEEKECLKKCVPPVPVETVTWGQVKAMYH